MAEFTIKLFRWMFSFIALLPLRTEFDEGSGKFKRFTFSFFHPEAWWYFSVLVVQIIFFGFLSVQLPEKIRNQLSAAGHDSIMLSTHL